MVKKLIVKIILISLFVFIMYSFYNKITLNEENNYSTDLPKEINLNSNNISDSSTIPDKDSTNVMVIADSHLNEKSFIRIKEIIKKNKIDLLIHLGDHTDFGSIEELKLAKSLLDNLNVKYFVLPGDRDLAAYGDDKAFFSIFSRNTVYRENSFKFLFINNSANFTPLSDLYNAEIKNNIKDSNFIFTSQPIYVEKGNILESKFMGSPTAFNFDSITQKNNQKKYLLQRDEILGAIRKNNNVLIISGDHHRSSFFQDSVNKSINYHIVGATAEYLNSEGITIKQKSFQSQRVSILSIKKDNSYSIKEIQIFEE